MITQVGDHWQIALHNVHVPATCQDGLRVSDRLPTQAEHTDPHLNASLIEELTHMEDAIDKVLDERERYIVCEHFGIRGRSARTMADIGKTMGLSRERVRQIESAALKRLRNNID